MMRRARLEDLLPLEALNEVQKLMQEGNCTATHLKPITHRYRTELLAKGVDADYLAYAIEYAMGKYD